jgi:RimJ/RimL family protein N-acetyltransferase
VEKIEFEPLKKKHKKRFLKLVNDPLVLKYITSYKKPYLPEHFDNFIKRIYSHKKPVEFTFAIIFRKRFVGIIEIFNIKKKKSEIGFWIGSGYHNKGIGTKAIRFIKEYASSLNLSELYADIMENNKAAVKILKRNGFSKYKKISNISTIYKYQL